MRLLDIWKTPARNEANLRDASGRVCRKRARVHGAGGVQLPVAGPTISVAFFALLPEIDSIVWQQSSLEIVFW